MGAGNVAMVYARWGHLPEHPAVLGIPDSDRPDAIALWSSCAAWCSDNGEHEQFPARLITDLGGTHDQAGTLVRAGLLDESPTLWSAEGSVWTWSVNVGGMAYVERYRLGRKVEGLLWGIKWPSRRKIPVPVRDLVHRRDGYRCCNCGSSADLTLDHIEPWSLGGSDHVSNLRTLCRSCNSRKGAKTL